MKKIPPPIAIVLFKLVARLGLSLGRAGRALAQDPQPWAHPSPPPAPGSSPPPRPCPKKSVPILDFTNFIPIFVMATGWGAARPGLLGICPSSCVCPRPSGQLVREPAWPSGQLRATLSVRGLPPGVYLLHATFAGHVEVRQVVVGQPAGGLSN